MQLKLNYQAVIESVAKLTKQGEDSLQESHESLLKHGFLHIPALLTADELNAIRASSKILLERTGEKYCKQLFDLKAQHWSPTLFRESGRNTLYFDPLGIEQRFDTVFNHLFSKESLASLLRRVLGPEFRLWQLLIRQSNPGAKNLVMHQDLPGEVGLAILLDDTTDGLGSTSFLPGSHRWPRLFHTNTHIDPSSIRWAIGSAAGRAGDGFLFYNSTWHGVLNSTTESRTAIILTFIPTAMSPALRMADPELIDRIGGNLAHLLAGREVPIQSDNQRIGPDEIVSGKYSVSLFSLSRLVHCLNLVYRLGIGVHRLFARWR